MFRTRFVLLALLAAIVAVLPAASQQPVPRPTAPQPTPLRKTTPPRLVPMAETKLLMDALNQSNFRALEQTLKQKEIDADSWVFARGQALLIAETGNLLMMRPPKGSMATDAWMQSAMRLRDSAGQLANTAAAHDQEHSRAGLIAVATACSSCHQTFRVPTRVTAFEEPMPVKP